MTRLLIVPAAGRGSRLSSTTPKLLVEVAGRPMIDHVLARYVHAVDRAIVVVSPAADDDARRHLSAAPMPVDIAIQEEPTGMLDAILVPLTAAARRRPASIWITWCDQVGISASTVARLIEATADGLADLALPTVQGSEPYVHFVRDASGRIVRVLQRREGDEMPAVGETDGGLFALSAAAYLEHLPAFAAASGEEGARTGERNFTPFIPWMASRGEVRTFPLEDPMEAVGVNTPAELRQMEAWLAARAERAAPPPPPQP
jgi:bifunctional UDP-N-acetylglucosamine pyrophosphorylase/glucosamine-1-phosphate N-acetyltransferase